MSILNYLSQLPKELKNSIERELTVTDEQISLKENFVLYVSPTGSDSNSGTSEDEPLQTFHAAMEKLPAQWSAQCRIYFAPGNYTLDAGPGSYAEYKIGQSVGTRLAGVGAERLGLIGSFTNVLGTRTSDGATTGVTVEDTSLSMTADEHIGKRLRFTTGASAGSAGTVVDNTTTAFTLNTAFSQAPGDQFVLETPAVTFTPTTYIAMVGSGNASSGIAMYAIEVDGANGSMQFDDVELIVEGVRFIFSPNGGSSNRLRLGGDAFMRNGGFDSYLPGVMSSFYNGAYIQDGDPLLALTVGARCQIGGYLVQYGTSGQYIGGNASYSNLHLCGGGGRIYVSGPQASLRCINTGGNGGRIIDATGDAAITIDLNATLERFDGLEISGAAGHGILVTNQSAADVRSISGTGNAGHGLAVKTMSTATVYNMTVTGTGGDVLVDATTVDHATAAAGTAGTGSRVEALDT